MNGINTEQFYASQANYGVHCVLAGAGTGKTRTLVEKARNVINHLSIDPEKILIITFSRKAADEIKRRVIEGIGVSASGIRSGTVHSFCLDLLRRNCGRVIELFGYSEFPSVMDERAREAAIMGLIHPRLSCFKGLPAGVIYDLVQNVGELSKETEAKLVNTGIMGEISGITEGYREIKRLRNCIDYDDMIAHAIDMLASDAELRAAVVSELSYVFVDEFQDTSGDDLRLLMLILPDNNRNLFVVGDDYQSIYGFRKARVEYIIRMKRYFPEAVVHRLTVNYRSRREIVKLSDRFIRKNRFRSRKRIISSMGTGGSVRFHTVGDFDEEAGLIRSIVSDEMVHSSGMAVLCRSNWQVDYLKGRIAPGDMGADIITMHSSKGLEFDAVIIAGVADGIIPDKNSDLEEERRVLYVAITRARQRLHIIVHRNEKGQLSRFGAELKGSGIV